MRLIDADLLVKVLNSRGYKIVSFYFGGIRKAFDTKEYIDKFPTINPEDLRPKGKWIGCDLTEYDEHGECIHFPRQGVYCSKCRNAFKKELLWKRNYCPNCGAKMEW